MNNNTFISNVTETLKTDVADLLKKIQINTTSGEYKKNIELIRILKDDLNIITTYDVKTDGVTKNVYVDLTWIDDERYMFTMTYEKVVLKRICDKSFSYILSSLFFECHH